MEENGKRGRGEGMCKKIGRKRGNVERRRGRGMGERERMRYMGRKIEGNG